MLLPAIITLQLLLGAPAELSIEHITTPTDIASFKGVSVSVDQVELNALLNSGSVRIPNFPLGTDRNVDLQLQRFEVLMPDAELVIGSLNRDGELLQRPIPRPNIVLLRGQIEGDPSSRVFIALGEHTTNGMIESEGRTYVLAMDQNRERTFVYNINDVDPEDMNWIDFRCGVEDAAIPLSPKRKTTPRNLNSGCIAIQVAIDTDYEFTEDLFDGNVAASSEYAITLVAAVSSIFQTDVDAALLISFLRLWDNPSDPWNASSTQAQLPQFRSYWQDEMSGVSRHLAHLLSGRPLGGGIAWLSAVCTSHAYAVSANLHGSFPQPLTDHHSNNWDLMVVAHETGHNVGTGHTHDYSPPIDGCGLGDCDDAFGGTIMSYCHTCSGGMTNIVLSFHELTQETIEDYLLEGVSCSLDCSTAIPGACCIDDTCLEITSDACSLSDGKFLGSGTLCDTGGCDPLQIGACCIGGLCFDLIASECSSVGGVPLAEITCDSEPCLPDAQFACCIGETCIDLTELECNEKFGLWSGLGVICENVICETVVNDVCDTAQILYSGAWEFTTLGAITGDEPYDNEECNTEFLGGINYDVWFHYTACESSQLLVSTCDSVDFDTDIVVYEGTCESMEQVACNGDGAGCPAFSSELILDVTEGETYLIRVGGFTDQSVGSGQIVLGGQLCIPSAPCRSDLNLDGDVNITDLLTVVDNWGDTSFEFDIDGDGIVGLGDVLIVLAEWGACEE